MIIIHTIGDLRRPEEMIKMKKERTIFDTAQWADLQKSRASELERYKKQVADLNKRLSEKETPLIPEQVVPMEIEETGHSAQPSEVTPPPVTQPVAPPVVQLQPPKGYILFPEPTKDEPVFIAEETEEDDT